MPRTAVCGMGICFECRVTINGITHQLACQTPVVAGMHITYGEHTDA
jgi:sarcosine oxidase subunit alpha